MSSKPDSFWDEAARRATGKGAPAAVDEAPKRKTIRREAAPVPAALVPTDDRLRQRLDSDI